MSKPFDFEVIAQEGAARAGLLKTRRGVIETPVFMPVGTAGTVKGIRFEELESPELDAQIILGNTYHLWLRPGIETIKACGGLHKFIGWERAMLTDSGGFQVWSLGALRKIKEEGTEFRSHLDGSLCFLSPEISMEVQAALDAEIAMAFDECAPGEATPAEARQSMELTLRWAQRSKEAFDVTQAVSLRQSTNEVATQTDSLRYRQALFGIIQGSSHLELRRESLERTVGIGLDQQPLDENCACSVCNRHTRAFIRHLYQSGEMLASMLLNHHNLAFFLDTMKRVRQAIRSDQFAKFRREFTEQLHSGLES